MEWEEYAEFVAPVLEYKPIIYFDEEEHKESCDA
jgi:hypothetical protein